MNILREKVLKQVIKKELNNLRSLKKSSKKLIYSKKDSKKIFVQKSEFNKKKWEGRGGGRTLQNI